MAKLGTLKIPGRSGAVYPFDVYPLSTVWTRLSAVYVFTHRDSSPDRPPEHVCVHLGESANIQDIGPVPAPWAVRANCFCILEEPDAQRRREILMDIGDAVLQPPQDS
jgi:hypothetical protein